MEIIARLREEREALVSRIAKIDEMLDQYEAWGREAEQLVSLTRDAPPESSSSGEAFQTPLSVNEGAHNHSAHVDVLKAEQETSASSHSAKTPMAEFEAAVIDVLRESGKPMDRVAIYDAMIERGVVIGNGGRDRDLNTLSARVYRMAQDPKNRISGERGQGYRLVEEPDTNETHTTTSSDELGVDDVFS